MKANVFRGTNQFGIEEVEQPRAGVGEAVVRSTLTTICGTDLYIVGEDLQFSFLPDAVDALRATNNGATLRRRGVALSPELSSAVCSATLFEPLQTR